MAGIARAGVDSAGGIIQPTQSIATINGIPIATMGASITGHGSGSHSSASIVEGSSLFTINGVPVVLAGMRASCNDQATGDGKHTCSA
ncbi:PAAR motif protein [compost metagenome]